MRQQPEVNEMQREIAAGSLIKPAIPDWSARVYGKQEFAGAGKTNTGLLVPLERRLARFVLPRIPLWLETYHLTLLTPIWSIGIVVFGYLAVRDLRWLWMVNLMIVLHYFTDHLDGKLGKFRDTGLRKWGFYMDHLFDYGFLCSILIGYSFLLPQRAIFSMMLVLCVFSAFMFHTFLMLAATDEFKVSFAVFGPTELRLVLIIINGMLVRFGVRPLKGTLPYIAVCGTVALALLAYRAQKRLWKSDMQAKAASAAGD
jgi:phosphatidylglycerophosphate synthase